MTPSVFRKLVNPNTRKNRPILGTTSKKTFKHSMESETDWTLSLWQNVTLPCALNQTFSKPGDHGIGQMYLIDNKITNQIGAFFLVILSSFS